MRAFDSVPLRPECRTQVTTSDEDVNVARA
jgi:hypothetical protein